jgi:hypothetical protein
VLAGTDAARACQLDKPPVEEQFATASSVFVARIVRTEEARVVVPWTNGEAIPIVEATFRVVEILRGQPPQDAKVKGLMQTCEVPPLMVGYEYILFLDKDGFAFEQNGTRMIFPDYPNAWDSLLKTLRELSRERR